jgi:hypothetical protein
MANLLSAYALSQEAREKVAKGVENLLSAAEVLSKVQALFTLYGSLVVNPEVRGDNPIAQPLPGEGVRLTHVFVTAGIDQNDWNSWQATDNEFTSQLHACAHFFDLPNITNVGDLASDISHWTVDWHLQETPVLHWAKGTHFTGPSQFSDYLIAKGANTGIIERWFEVLPDLTGTKEGPLVTVPVNVSIDVTPTASPQDQLKDVIGSFTNIPGLPVAVLNLGLSAFRALVPITRSVTINVTHHENGKVFAFCCLTLHASWTSQKFPYHIDVDYSIHGETCGKSPTDLWTQLTTRVTWHQTGYAQWGEKEDEKFLASPTSGSLYEGPFAGQGQAGYRPGDILGTLGAPIGQQPIEENPDAARILTAQIFIKPNPHLTQPFVATAELVAKPALPGAQVSIGTSTVPVGVISPGNDPADFQRLRQSLHC